MGREPGGCGLAATLQLVAGDRVPPACPSDGGEEIRLDTHTRTQLGTSPGGSCRLGRAGGRAAAVTAPAAGSGAPAPLGTGGSETQEGKIPAALTCSFGQIGREQAAQGAVTEDTGGSPLGAQSPGPRWCPRGARRMRASSRRAAAGPGTAWTRVPAAARAVPAPRERALPHLVTASRGSAGNAP